MPALPHLGAEITEVLSLCWAEELKMSEGRGLLQLCQWSRPAHHFVRWIYVYSLFHGPWIDPYSESPIGLGMLGLGLGIALRRDLISAGAHFHS